MERLSRRGASKAAKAELAAAKLKQLKDKGGKGRLNDIEEDDGPQAVYDVVRARSPFVTFEHPPAASIRSRRL